MHDPSVVEESVVPQNETDENLAGHNVAQDAVTYEAATGERSTALEIENGKDPTQQRCQTLSLRSIVPHRRLVRFTLRELRTHCAS
jgi:hypothetical protein